jgi:hypothetical protein
LLLKANPRRLVKVVLKIPNSLPPPAMAGRSVIEVKVDNIKRVLK